MEQCESRDEMLQCYDQQGNPTEARSRVEVRQLPPRYWFAVSRIWLVNDTGQIMCSKRAKGLVSYPGRWQTYFGGHVGAGESIIDTAQRELEEEAGIRRSTNQLFLIERGRIEEKKVFFESYATLFNGRSTDLHFSDREVSAARWMSLEEYEREQQMNPELWCNPCSLENQAAIRVWLTSREVS